MKLATVFLLVALVSYGCSPSAACEVLKNFMQKLLFSSENQYLEFINHFSPTLPLVKRAALDLKDCAESLTPDMKQAMLTVTRNLIEHCEN